MGKRKNEDEEIIQMKIRKLEERLQQQQKRRSRRRCRVISSSTEDDVSDGLPSRNTSSNPTATTTSSPDLLQQTIEVRSNDDETIEKTSREPETSSAPMADVTEGDEDVILTDDILEILGEAPQTAPELGKPIHKEIAKRWSELLMKGLATEAKDKLLKEYLVPSNCDLLLPPTLNLEAKAAVGESVSKRDNTILQRQNQIGITLAALSSATEALLNSNPQQSVLKLLSDACRLLCDMHFNETKMRRNLIITSINTNLKDTLINTVRDKFLFGKNIPEKLKAAKAIQRSGEELKNPTPRKPFNRINFITKSRPTSKNWKGFRKVPGKPDGRRDRAHQARSPPPLTSAPAPAPRSSHRRPRPSDELPPPAPASSRRFQRRY